VFSAAIESDPAACHALRVLPMHLRSGAAKRFIVLFDDSGNETARPPGM
jgi:hypothetical protein